MGGSVLGTSRPLFPEEPLVLGLSNTCDTGQANRSAQPALYRDGSDSCGDQGMALEERSSCSIYHPDTETQLHLLVGCGLSWRAPGSALHLPSKQAAQESHHWQPVSAALRPGGLEEGPPLPSSYCSDRQRRIAKVGLPSTGTSPEGRPHAWPTQRSQE
ncbi:hypothetical protein NDU88_011838 [Pleurodeles waltl]|uniref:Uncharacterized protein n=1 Tax=Pleurodeles waltl TaxID=8319 RepID=A0AAV7R164_PLEWA|nr:hypothetical protein NDU88_011838 [Pleurodeles waltl]